MRLDLIVPILIVLGGAVATLVVGIFLPREKQTWNAAFAGAVIVLALAVTGVQLAYGYPQVAFDGSFAADWPALGTWLVLLLATLGTLLLAVPVFKNDAREAEFYTLLLFGLLGAMLLVGAADVMEIVLGALMTSVAGYALVAYRRADPLALEAVLKYYLVGALANIALILGLVYLYGLSGTTLLGEMAGLETGNTVALAVTLTLVLVGLGFKGGWLPAHTWIPDVYQGTTVPVAAWLAMLPKVAALLAALRLLAALPAEDLHWPLLVAGLAAVTMTWGNLAAFPQTDIRRLLGYSSISQAGFMLLAPAAWPAALAVPGLLYYFAAYAAANLGAFAVLQASGRHTIQGNAGLGRAQPWLGGAMAICLLSFMGLPPLAGFVAKFLLFSALLDTGLVWLLVIGLINTVLSLYYYLRVITPMFFESPHQPFQPPDRWASGAAITAAVLVILLGLGAFLLLEPAHTVELLP